MKKKIINVKDIKMNYITFIVKNVRTVDLAGISVHDDTKTELESIKKQYELLSKGYLLYEDF